MKLFGKNASAHHHYALGQSYEAGLSLLGGEVKSLRCHGISLGEAFIVHKDGELFLHNAHISPYGNSAPNAYMPTRQRKLLLRKAQIRKISGTMTRQGMTAVPLRLYANEKGWIKVEISLATGLKKVDKRHALKEKEWQRVQHRILKQRSTKDI